MTGTPLLDYVPPAAKFDGSDYAKGLDFKRLTGQMLKLWGLMKDGKYRTLDEIERIIGEPPASISAQLRNLRKERFGKHTVDKRRRGERSSGLWEYSLTPNEEAK